MCSPSSPEANRGSYRSEHWGRRQRSERSATAEQLELGSGDGAGNPALPRRGFRGAQGEIGALGNYPWSEAGGGQTARRDANRVQWSSPRPSRLPQLYISGTLAEMFAPSLFTDRLG